MTSFYRSIYNFCLLSLLVSVTISARVPEYSNLRAVSIRQNVSVEDDFDNDDEYYDGYDDDNDSHTEDRHTVYDDKQRSENDEYSDNNDSDEQNDFAESENMDYNNESQEFDDNHYNPTRDGYQKNMEKDDDYDTGYGEYGVEDQIEIRTNPNPPVGKLKPRAVVPRSSSQNKEVNPPSCACKQVKLRKKRCWYFLGPNSNVCAVRACDAPYVCVDVSIATATCIRQKVTEQVVHEKGNVCKTVKVKQSMMYVPYTV